MKDNLTLTLKNNLMCYIWERIKYHPIEARAIWNETIEPYINEYKETHKPDFISFTIAIIECFDEYMDECNYDRSNKYWNWKYAKQARVWLKIMKEAKPIY